MIDFEKIREAHTPLVWNTVARILKHEDDALECFQEVFAEAIARNQRVAVTDWGAFLRWLATRRAIDALRRRRNRGVANSDVEHLCDSSQTAEQHAAFDELVERVRSELALLPERQAEAFWLVCVEQRSYDEVATLMDTKSNTVGVLVHRARQHMRSKLNSFRPAHSTEDPTTP